MWFLWFMIPVDPIQPTLFEKLPLLWFIHALELLLVGTGSWMYWWTYPAGSDLASMDDIVQIIRVYIVVFVGITTLAVLIWTTQFALRK